jgi:AraC-like DNA-binding protein
MRLPEQGIQEAGILAPACLPDDELRRAVSYIHANLAEPFSAGEVARAAGLNASQFTRLFKKMVGVPPRRYVTRARFELATKLIRAGGKNLTQIAAEAGFADQSHMTHAFRRFTGMTPRQFRRDPGLDREPGVRKDPPVTSPRFPETPTGP